MPSNHHSTQTFKSPFHTDLQTTIPHRPSNHHSIKTLKSSFHTDPQTTIPYTGRPSKPPFHIDPQTTIHFSHLLVPSSIGNQFYYIPNNIGLVLHQLW
jgi:hypothetical protein